jgi:hypothetical protein
MRRLSFLPIFIFLVFAGGCEVVTPTNPFDVETPPEEQQPGKIVGAVVLVDSFSTETRVATLSAVRVGLLDESGRPLAGDDGNAVTRTLIDPSGEVDGRGRGTFVFDGLVPGRYTVVTTGVPSYYAQAPTASVSLLPGATLDVGDVVFTAIGGDTGPGTIRGEVRLDGGAGGQRTVSLFERRDGQTVLVRSTTTDGGFELRGLNPGSYALVAESAGYAPSYRLAVTVDDNNLEQTFAGETAVVLRPVSGVVLPVTGPDVRLDDGAYYVRGTTLELALLGGTSAVDVGVTAMRIGTNPGLLDDVGAPLEFEDFSPGKTIAFPFARDADGVRAGTLVEGPVTVYAQLKADGPEGFSFTSPVFSTTVVRDVTAPQIIDPGLLGVPVDGEGVFLAAARALVVRFDAQDTTSGVDGVGIALGDGPPETLDDVTSPAGLVRFDEPLNAAVDGEASVYIVVEDKAGNRTEATPLRMIVDTTRPDVGLRIDNAAGGVLSSRVAQLAFDTTGAQNDLPVAVQLRVVGDDFGAIEPWTPEGMVVVVDPALGNDGDRVAIEARLFDRVGNEAVVDDEVLLRLRGTIAGTVVVDDPLLTPSAAGARVQVKTSAGVVVGEQVIAAEGGFAITDVPEGTGYAVEVALAGFRPARRAGIAMPAPDALSAPAVVDIERVELTTARGSVDGNVRLSDVDGDSGHGGITLTLSLVGPFGRAFVDATETDDRGDFTFLGVPATREDETVVVQARLDEYATTATSGPVVAEVVNTLPSIVLPKNASDFVICRPTGPCTAERFINTDVVRIRLVDPTDVASLQVSVAGGAVQDIPVDADNATTVSIAGQPDGVVSLVVRTQKITGEGSAPLAGSVVRDTVAPEAATLSRIADAAARDPRFTRQPFVDVELFGEAGDGAPLSLPRLIVADSAPENGQAVPELLGCLQGEPCRVDLPGRATNDVAERLHTIWGIACDLAGNCAAPLSTFVVHDRTPPRASSGAAFRVVATGSLVDTSDATPVTVLPSASYAGALSLGRAQTADGTDVVDENDVVVADVFAFRFSLSRSTLPRATLQSFSDPPVADAVRGGADVVVPALAPVDGTQTIFTELVDAAGNVGGGFDAAVRVDDDPPSLVLSVNGGNATRDPSVRWTVTVPDGGEAPVRLELRVDGGAPAAFPLPLVGDERITITGNDGPHRVQATGYDAVGNAAASEATIVLDRQGPRVDAFRCTSTTCTDDGLAPILSNADSALVDLGVVAADALSPVTAVRIVVDDGPETTFPIDAVRGVQLVADTQGTIDVAAVDAVGNVGPPLRRSFVHDGTAPVVSLLSLDGGAVVTQDLRIPVRIEASEDVVALRFSSSRAFTGAFSPFRNDDFVTLASGDGTKQVCVQVKDAAGNVDDECASILLDRGPPVGTISVVGPSTKNTLLVPVELAFSADTTKVAVSATALACESATTTYVPTTTSPMAASVLLTPGDGVRTLFACFVDGAGNVAAASAEVTIDRTAPVASATLGAGTEFATTTAVELAVIANEDAARMAVALSGTLDCAAASYTTFLSRSTVTLPSTDGVYTAQVCVEDAVGNRSAQPARASVVLDLTDPTGTVSIDGGNSFTTSLLPSVLLSNTSPDVVRMAATPNAGLDCATASYVAFSPGVAVRLPGPDGLQTVSVCLKDAAGRTARIEDSIVLDRAAPRGTIVVAGGATTTALREVDVTLTFDADTDGVFVSAFPVACAGAVYSAPTTTTSVSLPFVGENTVTACLRDGAGNVSTVTDDIFLENTAGDALVIAIDGGAAAARSRSVVVNLFRPSTDFTEMKLVEGPVLDCADLSGYEAFNTSKTLSLSSGTSPAEGTRTVTACVRSPTANTTKSASDTVFLDTFAPSGSITLDAGAPITRSATVTATLANTFAPQGEVVTVALSESSTLVGGECSGSFEAFAAARPFTFSGADGARSVFLCLRDVAGNTREVSDTITLDRAAPAPVFVTVPSTSTSTSVTASLNFPTDAVEIAIAAGALDCTTTQTYAAASATRGLTLAAVEGAQSVIACFKDAAGNVSQATASTVLDLVDPAGTVAINDGAAFTTTRNVTLALSASADVARMAIAEASSTPDCQAATYQAFTSRPSLQLSAGDGEKTVQVCLEDRAGRKAAAVPDTIVLDTTAPNGTLVIDDGAAATRVRTVTLALGAGGNADVVAAAVAEGSITCNASNLAYVPFSPVTAFLLSSGDGEKTLRSCLKDAAGNVSSTSGLDTITLDTEAPTLPAAPVDVVDGDGFLQAETTVGVTLRWTRADDAAFGKVAEGSIDCQSASGYVALSAAATSQTFASVPVSSGDGLKLFAACLKDAAGNVATGTDTTLRDGTAPTVTSLVCTDCTSDGTTTFSTDGAVSIAVTSDETGTGIASALVSVDGGADAAATVQNGVLSVGSLTAGARTLRVKLLDRAGNTSSTAQARTLALTVDTTAPALSSNADFRLNGQNTGGATNDPAVTVTIVNPPVDVVQMAIAEATSLTCASATYLPIATTSTFVVDATTQGTKSLRLCLKDRAGNTTAAAHTASITFDDLAPSLPAAAVVIQDGGDELLSSVTGGVSVRLNWNVVGDVVAFKLGDTTVDCSSAPYETPTGIATVNTTLKTGFALSSVDGVKLVAACFKDAAGNVVSAQDSTVLDQVGPNGSVLVNGGAAFATDASEAVTLTLRASPDVVRFVATETNNDACTTATVTCSSATGFTALGGTLVDGIITTTVSANLSGTSAAAEGAKCFEVCFEDAAGNRSAATALDGITFDKSAPSLLSSGIVVAGLDKNGTSQQRTRTPFVTVTLSGQPTDTAEMRLSEDGTFLAGTQPFVPFSTSAQQLTLSAGDATKTIFVQLKDRAGNTGSAAQKTIILDTTPPSGTAIVLAAGAAVTRNATVSAALQASGATEMKILTPDNGADVEAFTTFASSVNVALEDAAGEDGPKTVLVVFRDDAGNESAAASDGIDLDRTGPTADSLTCGSTTATGVCINAGASATNSVSASLALSATGATEVQIAADGCADNEGFVPFSTATSVLLVSGDATKTIAVRFRDAAGNVDQAFVNCTTTPGRTDTIVLDTVAPSPALSVTLTSAQAGDSAGFTATGQVRASLGFSPGAGEETSVKHGEGSVDCGTSAGYVALPGTSPLVIGDNNPAGDTPIALSSGDGTKTYVACFKDDAGNVTSTTGAIIVDTARPTGTIALNGGATTTNSTTVTATLTFSADTNGVAFVRDAAPTCSASLTYVAPSTTMTTTLSSTDGSKQLFACFRDAAGNFSATAASASITLDTTSPTVAVDARRAGSAAPGDTGSTRFTNTREVIVSVSALAADATAIALQNGTPTAPCSTAVFVPVPQAAPFNLAFTLDDSDTLQTIGVCARDTAGNVGTTTRQVKLDRTGPQVTLSLNAGAAITNATAATLTLTASPSNDPLRRTTTTDASIDCAFTTFSGAFAALPTSLSFTLPTGDGDKTAVACLQDEAGNLARAQDTITLDQTAPTGSFALAGGAAFATSTSVTLDFSNVSSDVTTMKTAEGASIDCANATGYTAFVNGTTATLSSTDGTKTLRACLKDTAGNTVQLSDSIVLDRVDPAVTFSLERRSGGSPDAAFTNSRELLLRITALSSDAIAIATAETSIDCGTASYRSLPLPLPTLPLLDDVTLAAGSDGARTIAICVKDAAGRTNGTLGTSASITLDTTPPSVAISLNAGASVTKSDVVSVTQTSAIVGDLLRAAPFATDANVDCTRASFSGSFATVRPTVSATLANPAGFEDSGTKLIVGCYQDRAGNTATASDDIFFDEERPGFGGRPLCSGCELVDATPDPTATLGDPFLGFTSSTTTVDFDVPVVSADVDFVLAMATTDNVQAGGGALGEDRACTGNGDCAGTGETCADFPVNDLSSSSPPVTAKRCIVATAFPDTVDAPVRSADGKFSVILALVDAAGNFSNTREVFVVRDTVAPSVSFSLNATTATRDQTVFVQSLQMGNETFFATTAQLGTFQASTLATFADALALPFTATSTPFTLADPIPVALTAGDGAKTVRVRVIDNAGNVGVVGTAAITLDTTPPTRPIFATGSAVVGPLSSPLTISLASLSTDTLSGLRATRPYNIGLPAGVDCTLVDGAATALETFGTACRWTGVAFTLNVAALGADGEKRIFVNAVDVAGNVSEGDVVTLQVDSVAPTRPCYRSGCVAPAPEFTSDSTTTQNVNNPSRDEHFATYQACVATTSSCSCSDPLDVPGIPFTVTLVDNQTNFVCIRAKDDAGNVSAFDFAQIVQDGIEPDVPQFDEPLTEVTGDQTTLLFSSANTSHLDTNFSHYEVIGGGHVDAKKMCMDASTPFCAARSVDRFFFVDGATPTKPAAIIVDLEPETENVFEVQAIDKAGNRSSSAVVVLDEGSLIVARSLSETTGGDGMSAFGDRVVYIEDDNALDDADEAVLTGPGRDLRYGTSDDERITLSTTVLVAANTTTASFDTPARQEFAVSGSPFGVVWVDEGSSPSTQSGVLRLRRPTDTLFDFNDTTVTLTPFASGCGAQKGFRNPSMSQDKFVVSCMFSDTDYDVYLARPGVNGSYEATGTVGRDDIFLAIASTGLREHLPALSQETAVWVQENSANKFSILVRRPGDNGILDASGDDETVTLATDLTAAQLMAPAVYMPDDPSVPACAQGVAYVTPDNPETGATNDQALIFHGMGPDERFGTPDDTKTVLETQLASDLTSIVSKVQIGPGVIVYKAGFLDTETVVSPGKDRCYANKGEPSDDVRIDNLSTFGSADIAAGQNGWFEFSTPGIFQNQILFHDLITRRALVDGSTTTVSNIAMGGGFAAFTQSSGQAKLFDFVFTGNEGVLLRSTNQSAVFQRSIRSGGNKLGSSEEGTDALFVIEPDRDGNLFTPGATSVRIASDATGGQVIDDIAVSQRNFGLSSTVFAFFTGVDPGGGAGSFNVRLQFAGGNGTFELDGGGNGEDDCQANITAAAASRSFLTVDGTRVAWVNRDGSGNNAGALQVFEPTSTANPCGGGTTTTLTDAVFTRVRNPVLAGNRIVAFETDASGVATNLVQFETRSNFRSGATKRRSCRVPTGWNLRGGPDTLTMFEGNAIFIINPTGGNLAKMLACDLTNDTVRLLDPNQPGGDRLSASGRTLVVQSFADDSVFQYQLDR